MYLLCDEYRELLFIFCRYVFMIIFKKNKSKRKRQMQNDAKQMEIIFDARKHSANLAFGGEAQMRFRCKKQRQDEEGMREMDNKWEETEGRVGD